MWETLIVSLQVTAIGGTCKTSQKMEALSNCFCLSAFQNRFLKAGREAKWGRGGNSTKRADRSYWDSGETSEGQRGRKHILRHSNRKHLKPRIQLSQYSKARVYQSHSMQPNLSWDIVQSNFPGLSRKIRSSKQGEKRNVLHTGYQFWLQTS